MLKLEKLLVRVNRKNLLSSINLEIAAGEVVALCGPNGAGKSTIVSAIAGIIHPVSGRILLAGKPLEKKTKSEIGFMFQHAEFMDNVRVKEMLCLYQSFYRSPCSFNKLVHFGLLQEMLLKKTHELSGGERKRLSFALSNKEISKRLFLSEGTVRNYFSDVFQKLRVKSRTEAIHVAQKNGLIGM